MDFSMDFVHVRKHKQANYRPPVMYDSSCTSLMAFTKHDMRMYRRGRIG